MQASSLTSAARPGELPPAARWLLLFQFANGINFTIALGAPMVLCAKFLGAPESVVGTLLSFTPFMVVLQLLASNTAERWGYKRLVLAGWGTRSFMILLAAPLPLLAARVSHGWLLAVLALLLLAFNIIRGYTCIGFLPWVSRVIPENCRGRYFGLDQTFCNTGVLLGLLGSSLFIRAVDGPWKYSVLFIFSWMAGMISVRFLRLVPGESASASAAAAPPREDRSWSELRAAYRRVWASRPFRLVTLYAALNSLAMAGFGGFLVVFQRDALRIRDGNILALTACGTLGPLLTAMLWGRFTDRFGSRPALRLGGGLQLAVFVCWALIAGGLLPRPGMTAIATLFFLSGVAQAATALSLTRLLLTFCPPGETTIGITLHGVLVSLCAGTSPLVWGFLLDFLRFRLPENGFWQPFTVFFLCGLALVLATQFVLRRIRETRAMPTAAVMVNLFIDWPLSVVSEIGWFNNRPDPDDPDRRA